jgi:hypothetical protein
LYSAWGDKTDDDGTEFDCWMGIICWRKSEGWTNIRGMFKLGKSNIRNIKVRLSGMKRVKGEDFFMIKRAFHSYSRSIKVTCS